MEKRYKTFQAGITNLVPLLIKRGFKLEAFKPVKDPKSLSHLHYIPVLIAHAIEHGNLCDFHTCTSNMSSLHYRFLKENIHTAFGWRHDEYQDDWIFYWSNL